MHIIHEQLKAKPTLHAQKQAPENKRHKAAYSLQSDTRYFNTS